MQLNKKYITTDSVEPTSGLDYTMMIADKDKNDAYSKLSFIYEVAKTTRKVVFDIETSGLVPFEEKPLILQFGVWYDNKILSLAMRATHNKDRILELFKKLLSDKKILVIGHNLGFEYRFIKHHYNTTILNVWDTQIVESALTMGKGEYTDLGATTDRRLGVQLDKVYQKTFIKMRPDAPFTRQQWRYAAEDVVTPYHIYQQQKEEAKRDGLEKIVYLENKLTPILSQTFLDGVQLDKNRWMEQAEVEIDKRIGLIKTFMEKAGIDNIPMPPKKRSLFEEDTEFTSTDILKHLVDVSGIQSNAKLCENLKKFNIKTSKVDKDAFNDLKGADPIIDLLIEEKKIRTRINMFWLKWLNNENEKTGRWHPDYTQLPSRDNTGKKADDEGTGASSGRLSCIAEGQPIAIPGGFKNIEDIKIGDWVYCFDKELNICLRKVTNVFDNGYRDTVKLDWQNFTGTKTGSIICTPDHRVKLIDGEWESAENCKDKRVMFFSRYQDKNKIWHYNSYGRKTISEQILIKKDIFGVTDKNIHIHHKDEDPSNNLDLSNFELLPRTVHLSNHGKKFALEGKIKTEHLASYRHLSTRKPTYKSKFTLLKMLHKSGGSPVYVDMDFGTYKKKCEEKGINLNEVGKRFNKEGLYLSKSKVSEVLAGYKRVDEASKALSIGTRRLKELCSYYNLDYNHKIVNIENSGVRHVYDIEVEDCHNFFVGEIGVHNCKTPNIQQVVADNKLRKCFIARPGKKIITLDYAAVEARICANLSMDPNLIKFFKGEVYDKNGDVVTDIHGYNCSLIFGLPLEDCVKTSYIDKDSGEEIEVDPKETGMRKIAKIGVFAVIYGANAFALTKQLNISLEKAEEFIARMREAYPTLFTLLESTFAQTMKRGYVVDAVGRRKYFSLNRDEIITYMEAYNKKAKTNGYAEITSYEKAVEKAKDRVRKQCGNLIIQAVNASQLKYAICKIREKYNEEELKFYAFIHDEIVVEVDEEGAYEKAVQIKKIMIDAATAIFKGSEDEEKRVPYDVAFKVESTWIK